MADRSSLDAPSARPAVEGGLPQRDSAGYRLAGNGAMKILLIEDDKEAAEYLVKALSESGYVVGSAAAPTTTKLRVAELEMDLLTRAVRRDGQAIDLLPREFRLLEYLMRHAGQVVTRTMLLESVWDYHFDPQTNVIDVHISRLRQKIDKGFAKPLLHTIPGAGYSLRPGD